LESAQQGIGHAVQAGACDDRTARARRDHEDERSGLVGEHVGRVYSERDGANGPRTARRRPPCVARAHSNHFVRVRALRTLFQLEPATLAWHANAVVARLEDSDIFVRDEALATLKALPHVVTRGVDLRSSDVRSRLLGRLAWHRFRLLKRVQRIALYWYALPYRPSGAGHARDVEAWAQMVEIQDHRNISS